MRIYGQRLIGMQPNGMRPDGMRLKGRSSRERGLSECGLTEWHRLKEPVLQLEKGDYTHYWGHINIFHYLYIMYTLYWPSQEALGSFSPEQYVLIHLDKLHRHHGQAELHKLHRHHGQAELHKLHRHHGQAELHHSNPQHRCCQQRRLTTLAKRLASQIVMLPVDTTMAVLSDGEVCIPMWILTVHGVTRTWMSSVLAYMPKVISCEFVIGYDGEFANTTLVPINLLGGATR